MCRVKKGVVGVVRQLTVSVCLVQRLQLKGMLCG